MERCNKKKRNQESGKRIRQSRGPEATEGLVKEWKKAAEGREGCAKVSFTTALGRGTIRAASVAVERKWR